MATITSVGLIAAYPEWTSAPTDVVASAISVANAKSLGLYVDRSVSTEDEEIQRRYLEACTILYRHPFGRDMRKVEVGSDPYLEEIKYRDKIKGSLYRAPGWPDPGISEY